MSTEKTITLTHYEDGPMQVAIYDDATWWTGHRTWYIPDDPERGNFEDEDFTETKEQIDALLEKGEAVS